MTASERRNDSRADAADASAPLLEEMEDEAGVQSRLSSGWRALIAAVLAGAAYAGWAFLANAEHGSALGFSAAVTQGAYSFTAALVTTLLLDRLRHSFGPSWRGSLTTLVLSCGGLTTIGYLMHWGAGTPEILVTISPGAILGTAYAAAYVIALDSRERTRLAQLALGD